MDETDTIKYHFPDLTNMIRNGSGRTGSGGAAGSGKTSGHLGHPKKGKVTRHFLHPKKGKYPAKSATLKGKKGRLGSCCRADRNGRSCCRILPGTAGRAAGCFIPARYVKREGSERGFLIWILLPGVLECGGADPEHTESILCCNSSYASGSFKT